MMGYSPVSPADPVTGPFSLLAGVAVRIVLYCASVSAVRMVTKRPDEDPKRRIKRRALYAATEIGVGIFMCGPATASVFANVPRFTCNFVVRMSETLGLVDGFDVGAYHSLAEELIPLDDALPYAAWVLGGILTNLALTLYTRRYTTRKVPLKKVALVTALQAVARFTGPSFVVSLPRDEAELLLVMSVILLDKYTTSWLARTVTPWE